VAVGLSVGEAVAEGEGDGDGDGVLVAVALAASGSVADTTGMGDAVGSDASAGVELAATVLVRWAITMASVGWDDLLRPARGPSSKNKPPIRSTATSPSPAMAQPGGRPTWAGPNQGIAPGFFATPSVLPVL
jgi:hypothetical protein